MMSENKEKGAAVSSCRMKDDGYCQDSRFSFKRARLPTRSLR